MVEATNDLAGNKTADKVTKVLITWLPIISEQLQMKKKI